MAFFGFPQGATHFGAATTTFGAAPTLFGTVPTFGVAPTTFGTNFCAPVFPTTFHAVGASLHAPVADTNGTKLTYLPSRGLAEGIRYALSLAQIPWVEEHLTEPEQFEALKDTCKLPFDQVPLLEFRGGFLVQSGATIRAIGRHSGLYGATPAEAYRVDSLLDAANDVLMPIMQLPFQGRTPEKLSAALEGFVKKVAIFERLFEHQEETGRDFPFLVRPTPTVADSQLALALRWAVDELGEPAADAIAEAPLVARFLEVFESIPQIAAYLAGPQRLPIPDDATLALVKKVFGRE